MYLVLFLGTTVQPSRLLPGHPDVPVLAAGPSKAEDAKCNAEAFSPLYRDDICIYVFMILEDFI